MNLVQFVGWSTGLDILAVPVIVWILIIVIAAVYGLSRFVGS